MLTVEADALSKALKATLPALGKSHLSVLQGVKIEAADGRLRLECSDLQGTAVASVPCSRDELSTIVSAHTLIGLVAKMSGPLGAAVKDGQLIVEDANGGATLRTFALQDWPQTPTVDATMVALDKAQVDKLRLVLRAASSDVKRPALTGLHLDGAKAVATDSYRLFAVDLGADLGTVTVPAEPLKAALGDHEHVSVGTDGRYVVIEAPDAEWRLRSIEDDYPQYERLVGEKPGPVEVEFDAEQMLDRIDRVSTLAGSGTNACVRLAFDGERVAVTALDQDVGEAVGRMEAVSSEPVNVAFHPGFLRDFVSAFAPTVTANLTNGMKPAVAHRDGLSALLMAKDVKGWSTGSVR